MRKTFLLAIVIVLSTVINAQTNLSADEIFYSQHVDEIMQMFSDECPVYEINEGDGPVYQYALVDFDGDGIMELWLKEIVAENGAFFCHGGDSLEIIAVTWSKSFVSVNGNIVCASGPAGTGAFYAAYSVIENSAVTHFATDMQIYNIETDKVDHECEYDGKEVTWKWFKNKFDNNSKKFVEPHNDVWLPFERLSSDVPISKVSGTYYRQEYGESDYYTINVVTDGKGNACFEARLYSNDVVSYEISSDKWLPIENKTITYNADNRMISIEMYGRCLYVTENNSSSSRRFSGNYYRDPDTFGDNNGNLYIFDYEKEGAVLISRGATKGKIVTPDKVLYEYGDMEVPVVGVDDAVLK